MKRGIKSPFTKTQLHRALLLFAWLGMISGAHSLSLAQAPGPALSIYGGPSVGGVLENLINFLPPPIEDQGLVVLALQHPLGADSIFELETHLGKNLEPQGPWQAALALNLRFRKTPWSKAIPSSFAIGNGLSYATSVPLPEATDGSQKRLLWLITLEFTFEVWKKENLSIITRIHHRSGMFGVFGTSGGSNYVTAGLRWIP